MSVIRTPPAVLDAFGSLYRKFVKPGDLVFDIGANIGENTALFAELGAHVIAVEPLAECSESIAAQAAGAAGEVQLEQCAVGSRAGMLELAVCSCALDISSASPTWISAMQRAGLARGPWDQRVTVPVITLDALIARYGSPSFVKVDVEGYELEALRGLSHRVGGISLETHRATLDDSLGCLDCLRVLGFKRFAISPGHSAELSSWMGAREAASALATLEWGDLYAC